jgi:peptide/nickel transport system permease protein
VDTLDLKAEAPQRVKRSWRLPSASVVRFFGLRILRGLLVLFLLSIVAFALIRMVPGDPVTLLAGPYSDEATREALRRELGLDGSLIGQYLHWIANALQGDFGTSVFNGLPVRDLITDRLPNTLQLSLGATIISVGWGVPFGVLAAMRRGSWFDRMTRSFTFLGLATPVFAFGVVLVLLASVVLPSWPVLAYVPFSEDPVQNLKALVLPSLALGLPLGATIARFMRASMLDVYEQDFMRTARAGGATRLQATLRHGMRNAAAPVVTVAGLQMAGVVGQSILIENVFAIPGIGQLTVTSILQKDYGAAQACILVLGAVYVAMNFIVDLLYPLFDPKVGGGR